MTFEGFQGLELRPLFGPEDGQLEPIPGRIATHDSGVFAKDFVADATFTRSQTQWDYGFKFRAAGGDPDVSDQYRSGWHNLSRELVPLQVATGRRVQAPLRKDRASASSAKCTCG